MTRSESKTKLSACTVIRQEAATMPDFWGSSPDWPSVTFTWRSGREQLLGP